MRRYDDTSEIPRVNSIMYTRHEDVPLYEVCDGRLDANHYNHVQIALNHLGESLRLALPRLRSLELILQRDAWIVVDSALGDVPVIAWSDFETGHRTALHEPVACRIRLYHASADILLERVLEAMELLLGEQLENLSPEDGVQVIPFRTSD